MGIEDFNKRFAKEPSNQSNAHRLIIPDAYTLERIFSHQHQRKLSKNLALSYNNVLYQVQTDTPSYTMRKAYVTVCDRAGKITLLYKGKTLQYKVYDKNNKPTKVMDSKQISTPKEVPKQTKPAEDHPWRQYDKTASAKARQQNQANAQA